MSWEKLLSAKRLDAKTYDPDENYDLRSEFQKDVDRIIFSSAFRRLQDKTQVMPMPDSDYVRSRLTHSIEVASVARSLGKLAGNFIIKKESLNPDKYDSHIFSDILAAASLAHDIGNPPFGHSGESSIRKYFKDIQKCTTHAFNVLSGPEKKDFLLYEGNASGFRILTNDYATGISNGLKLTCATLGTFSKYPCASVKPELNTLGSSVDPRQSLSKYGFFMNEISIFELVAAELELIPLHQESSSVKAWARHPLAFLLEAADSLTYHIIDYEDGCKLGFIPYDDAINQLSAIISLSNDPQCTPDDWRSLAKPEDQIGALRGKTIRALIHECFVAFKENYEDIMTGKFDKELTSIIPSAGILQTIKDEHILENYFRHVSVLDIELTGFKVLGNLLNHLIESIIDPKDDFNKKLLIKLPGQYSAILKDGTRSFYQKALTACDFICRMTDGYALSLYQKLNGIHYT